MSENLSPVVPQPAMTGCLEERAERANSVGGAAPAECPELVGPPELASPAERVDCPQCHNTGMISGDQGMSVCSCAAGERFWNRLSRAAGVPSHWRTMHLRSYAAVPGASEDPQWTVFTEIYAWAHRVWYAMRKNRPEPRGLLLYGARGTGKSTLAAAVANSLLRARLSVEWANVPRLYLEALQAQHQDEGALGVIDRLAHPEVLILDDIGAKKASDYAQGLLYNVLEDRANRGRILVATSNLDPYARTPDGSQTELEARIGERNASRLLGLCSPMAMSGEDLRKRN